MIEITGAISKRKLKVDYGHRKKHSNDKKKLSVDELIELLRKVLGEQFLKNLTESAKKSKMKIKSFICHEILNIVDFYFFNIT